MCGGGSKPKPKPAPKPKAPKGPASTPAGAAPVQSAQTVETGSDTSVSSAARRRRAGKRSFRVGLDVNVANVGGSGKSGLNIPKSD